MSREPITIVEIDVDGCTRTFGAGACTASLTGQTVRKCYNTFATCRLPSAFNRTTTFRTLRFCQPRANMPKGATYFPAVTSISEHSSTVNIAGSDDDLSSLGRRATVKVGFLDFPYHDRLTDPYQAERASGAAQTDEAGYDPSDRGTFWTKLKARWPYYAGRALRVINASIVDGALTDQVTRHYVITGVSGPDSDGGVTVEASDVLDLASNEKAVAPKTSSGVLLGDISASATTMTLSPTGIGASEYPASGRALIGSEIVTYTRSGDTITLTGRGMARTTAASHSAGDTFQQVLRFNNTRVDAAVYALLVTYAGIDPAFISFADWQAEVDRWMPEIQLNTHIVKPTGVATLVGELAVLGVSIWWDGATQKIRLKANRPPDNDPVFAVTDRSQVKSISHEDQDDKRLTQIHFYSVQTDPTKSGTSAENYDRMMATVDLAAQEAWAYGKSNIRTIHCRWLDGGADGAIRIISKRLLKRFNAAPAHYTILLDAKDRAIGLTDILSVSSRVVMDETGRPVERLMQVIQRSEPTPGHEVKVVAQAYQFDGRFGYCTPNDWPVYDSASVSQKAAGNWAVDEGTLLFADGTEPYEAV